MTYRGDEKKLADRVLEDMPFWDTYDVCQDSPTHYRIRRRRKGKLLLSGLSSRYENGGSGRFRERNQSIAFSIRDFWQTYPSGYTFKGLTKDKAEACVWLYSPSAEAMDFRHYAERGYNQVYYEGYDYKGATP